MSKTELSRWCFGEKADVLANKVKNGNKTATCSLYSGQVPKIGEQSIIVDSNGNDVCVIEIINYKILPFNEITEEMAIKEGEGHLEKWKDIHRGFFTNRLKVNKNTFDDNVKILYEEFKVIEKR